MRWDDLVERDGLYFNKFTDTRFTGKVSGKKQGEIKDGILEGEWVNYFGNGQLYGKGSYKNGEKEDEWVDYRKDGTINSERSGTFKNGRKVSD